MRTIYIDGEKYDIHYTPTQPSAIIEKIYCGRELLYDKENPIYDEKIVKLLIRLINALK